jgi:nucleoid DNA-binding protein
MNKYIIELLKLSGRVIIPDFGCLSIDDDGKTVFNTYIKFDDGKLSSYICEQSGAEPQDVINKISAWARELKAQVNTGVDYELVGLGSFYKTGPDEIDFRNEGKKAPSELENERVSELVNEIQNEKELENKIENEEKSDNEEIDTVSVESKHSKNIYIPPSEDLKKEEKMTSLDDVLGITPLAEETANEAAHRAEIMDEIEHKEELVEKPIIVEAPKAEPKPVEIKEVTKEEVIPVAPADKTEKQEEIKEATQAEEVTVKRKRGVFFYINIALLALILGLSVCAYFYMDELSRWLGIKTENVLPEPESKEELVEEEVPVLEEQEEQVVVEEPLEEISETPVDQPIIQETPAVSAGGNFHIIVGTFSVKENADRLVQKIRDAGYDGKIITSTDNGHTVSFHTYNTKDEAANQISKAKEITGTSAYVLKR